ncbi:hypothetical protein PVAP13_9NG687200 [Panicum virgatum]|uniref:Uncharacterized protein n=1 Tax=Panicum virgatum TaxID=38727 RepID=A0A8T0N0U5_PANVG|nr:hypothetical protein PVAP13_9NG687200 [Panicum virgatum]
MSPSHASASRTSPSRRAPPSPAPSPPRSRSTSATRTSSCSTAPASTSTSAMADLQGQPAPAPAAAPQPRGGEQALPACPGEHVRVRRLCGGVPVQPRGGGLAGRRRVHGHGGGAGVWDGQDLAAPNLGPRRHSGPGR